MTAYALNKPSRGGALLTLNTASATDTISKSALGAYGVSLVVINEDDDTADTVTISDASTSRSGGAAAAISQAVAFGTSRAFRIHPSQADKATGLVTITHSSTVGVKVLVIPLGPNDVA